MSSEVGFWPNRLNNQFLSFIRALAISNGRLCPGQKIYADFLPIIQHLNSFMDKSLKQNEFKEI